MSEKILLPSDFVDSVKQFRSAKSNEGADGNWMIFGYEGKNNIICIATGTGGVESSEFQSNMFPSNPEARYAIIRRDWKVEMANTVKFILVDYTPDNIPPMRKALLSTHKGQIKDAFKPFSVNLEISKPSEISDELITEKIGESSGTANKTTTKAAQTYQSVDITRSTGAHGSNLVPSSVQANRPINFTDEQAIKDAIKDVRSDKSDTNWMLIHYSNPTTLELIGSGSGGVDELISHLNDTEVFYGFFRVVETYDKTQNVKFCFVKLLSPNLPPMQKAKLTTQSGFVQSIFQPYHTDFDIQSVSDLNVEIVTDKIQRLQNTKQVILTDEQKQQRSVAQTSSNKHDSGIPNIPLSVSGAQLTFNNPDEWKSALADVRTGTCDWLLVSAVDKNTISLIGKGTGGVESLKQQLENNNINFGLVRVEDVIDKSVTIKFVLIKSQPETVPAMKKSAVSTKKGLFDALFAPYHVSIDIATPDEVSQETVMNKVQSASGSKSNVVDKK